MLKQTFYSIKNLYKSWSIYFVVTITSLFYLLLVICRKSISGAGFLVKADAIMWMWNLPMYFGIFIAITMVSKSLFTSKDYTSSQTLIVTKPITRLKITLSKLLTMLFIGFIQVMWWLCFALIVSKEDSLTAHQTSQLATGVFVYGLLVALFSIIVNLAYSLFLKGKTLFIISIMTATILSIFTFVNQTQISQQAKFNTKHYEYFTLDEKFNKGVPQKFILDTRSKDAMAEKNWNKYNPKTYSITSVFDIYHKMNMFSIPESPSKEAHKSYIYTLNHKILPSNSLKIKIKNSDGIIREKNFIFKYEEEFFKRKQNEFNSLMKHQKMFDVIKSNKNKYEQLSLEQQVFFIKEVIRFENGFYDEKSIFDKAYDSVKCDDEYCNNRIKREFADSYAQVFKYLEYLDKHSIKTSLNKYDIQEYLFNLPSTQMMYLIDSNKEKDGNYINTIEKKELVNEDIFPIILIVFLVAVSIAIIVKEKYEWIK